MLNLISTFDLKQSESDKENSKSGKIQWYRANVHRFFEHSSLFKIHFRNRVAVKYNLTQLDFVFFEDHYDPVY